jgi:precorrin-3B synthase
MTARAIFFSRLRGACPGLSVPMPTGDGLLVRLLPVGTMSLDAFANLCVAARRHGNGIIEITARGSIQIRGLSATSAPRFADAVASLNIAADDGVSVLNNALSGLDPDEILDAGGLAADLRRALAETALAAWLAPKVSVAIDGGRTLGLDTLAADVRLHAVAANDRAVLGLSVGGDGASATQLGLVTSDDAVKAVVRVLEILARNGRAARARDLIAANGTAAFRAAVADLLIATEPPRNLPKSSEPIGAHRLRNATVAVGIGLAFGHADAATLERLAEAARSLGAAGLRTAPGRALLVVGLVPPAASSATAIAENLGFITRADDPRRRVIACAGAPICASAHIAARALAPQVAAIAAAHLGPAFDIHISGCGKGCAYPRAAALTIVGSADGCALIADGSVRDPPCATVATHELLAAIEQCARAKRREGGRDSSQEDRHV